MKDQTIRSDRLLVSVNPFGAELKSVEMEGLEYLWQGDPETYARTSPTLFPIVGRFLSDTYFVGNKAYHMNINGFAMERNFEITEHTPDSITLSLAADLRTLAVYPYDFRLEVQYKARDNALAVQYRIENAGSESMPFGVGCHTAYRWPLFEGEDPKDYFLHFEKEEDIESFNPFGWREPFVQNTDIRPLDHSLFINFTRSITNIRSAWIGFENKKNGRGVRIFRDQFPFMAIWTQPTDNASFVCLEPCTSIQPGDRGCTTMFDRVGIQVLAPGASAIKEFRVEFL